MSICRLVSTLTSLEKNSTNLMALIKVQVWQVTTADVSKFDYTSLNEYSNGVNTIFGGGCTGFDAWCDLQTDNGGWTYVMHVERQENDIKVLNLSGMKNSANCFKGRSSTRKRFREEFQQAQKSFDRKLKQCERHYRQSFCLEIDNMVISNPSDFWDKIKKLGLRKVQNIPMEVYGPNGEILTDDDSVENRFS
ncbi:unnamed protein product [Mytilus coruscus]|uniref:Fibrinogen C-terminal domain-containing protein n=1 Tax=Mytilus coruscus TaxID=42192 RepID=A0A6J8DXS5_MYTCO|nr:unnamed protein product [Mytilus coruscus]